MKKLIISFIALFSFIGLNSQDLLLPEDALRIGLERNYQIQIVKENVEIARNNNTWGAAGALPSLMLTLNSNNSTTEGPSTWTQKVETTNTTMLSPKITMNWTIFSGFRVKITKQNLEDLERLSIGNSAIVVENAIQGILLAYYQVALYQKQLLALQEMTSLSKDRLEWMEARKEFGSIGTYELLQSKTAYLADSSNLMMVKMNLNSARMNLNLLMAESSGKIFQVADSFPQYPALLDFASLYKQMIESNQTLQNQYINQEILKNTSGLKKSALYPSLSMVAGAGLSSGQIELTDRVIDAQSNDYYANFTLSFNLFNGGNTRREIENARISEKIGRIQIEQMQNQLSVQLYRLVDLYHAQYQLYQLSQEQINLSKLNLELSKDKYESGAINSFNYREVQIQHQNAVFNSLSATFNLLNTYLEISRLTGGFIREDFGR